MMLKKHWIMPLALALAGFAQSADNTNVDRDENPEMFVDLKKADPTDEPESSDASTPEPSSFKPKAVTLDQSHWSTLFKDSQNLSQVSNDRFTFPALYQREQRGGASDALVLVYASHAPPGRDPMMDSLRKFLPSRGVATLALVYEPPAALANGSTPRSELTRIDISQLIRATTAFLEKDGYTNSGVVIGPAVSQMVLADTPINTSMGAHAWFWLSPSVNRKDVTKLGDIPLPIMEISDTQEHKAYRRAIKNPYYQFKHLWGSRYGAASTALPISQTIKGFLKKHRRFQPDNQTPLEVRQPKVFKGQYTGGQ